MPSARQPLIFGEVLFDRFPDGNVVLGGAPFNVAWHLHAFGAAPLFVSRVGNDDLGRRIQAAMQAWGMNSAGLQLDSQHPTGTVEVSFAQGEPAYDIVAGRAYDCITADPLPPVTPALIYHGTLALRAATSLQTLETLKSRYDAPVFLDVNLRPPWWELQATRKLLDNARWVKLNEDELGLLGTDSGTLDERAGRLRDTHGNELLIVTRGGDGAVAFSSDGQSAATRPGSGNTVVDTVGAGDAFTSVTILGLLRDWPLQQTLDRAQTFASAVVGVRGATVQDRDFYRPFIDQWELPAA
jgi:fructokinase